MAAQQLLVCGLPGSRPSAAGQRGRGSAHVTCVATPTRPPATKPAKRCGPAQQRVRRAVEDCGDVA